MDLAQIAVMLAFAALYLTVLPARWRGWALMIGSLFAIYWLQPTLTIRWLDYALPTACIALAVAGWYWSRPPDARLLREDLAALVACALVALILLLPRYVDVPLNLTSRPPPVETALISLLAGAVIALGLRRFVPGYRLMWLATGLIVLLFIVIKTPALATAAAGVLRANAGQDAALATGSELGWLGFSYVAFRLIHTFRDRQSGLLPALGLREYVTYIIFAPAYVAGPIDRAERFSDAFRALPTLTPRDPNRLTHGMMRIATGLFKKFVIADSLAVFSLSPSLIAEAQGGLSAWVMLYAYALRIFFDFSGYTDIAIGLALLVGIPLPENFDRPYLKPNLTAFWQSWHQSLTDWARFYIYSPISRAMLRRKPKPSTAFIILTATAATMITVGLWHEITLPFLAFGLWHTAGLFAHKLWTDRTRAWYRGLTGWRSTAWRAAGILLTFHFVALGWVWFAMPTLNDAAITFGALVGIGGTR